MKLYVVTPNQPEPSEFILTKDEAEFLTTCFRPEVRWYLTGENGLLVDYSKTHPRSRDGAVCVVCGGSAFNVLSACVTCAARERIRTEAVELRTIFQRG